MEKEYFAHETAVIDEGCKIGKGTKIWHFSHIMAGAEIGERCNIGQNVVVSPGVKLGKNVKVQNNVSIYTGVICDDDVFLGPSMVYYPGPLHIQNAFKYLGYSADDFPVTTNLCREVLSLPMHPDLEPEQMDHIVNKVLKFFETC